MNATKEKYIDVTYKYKLKNNKKPKVIDLSLYESNGKKYYVDGKKVVLDYSQKEYEIAIWLSKTFGSTVYMCPRINYPFNIKTPDYIINNEKWDLKEISGNKQNTIDDSIKNKKNQSKNFIIDLSKSNMNETTAINNINKIFLNKERRWVKELILIENNKLICYFKRK